MKLQNVKGTRDFPPEEKILRNNIVGTLKEVFELYGFYPLDTPIIESYELLSAKCGAGEESDAMKETYTFTDQGKRKLGLRFELTLSTARFVAMNPDLKMPFKRYQMGDVFRDGPIKLGRYREFTQCDVDIFGTKSVLADAECVSLALFALKKLGFDAYIELNNRKLLNGLIEQAGIPKGKSESIMIIIDKLQKYGEQQVRKELDEKGIEEGALAKLLSFFNVAGSNQEKLEMLKGIVKNDLGKEGIAEIEEVLSCLSEDEKKNIKFVPSLARGLGYYTGTVFEGFIRDSEITSSILGGGRYDEMVKGLVGKDVPAVGFAFGLEPITEYIKLGNKGKMQKTLAKVLVVPIGVEKEAMKIANELRSQGINTDFAIGKKGISKALDYANYLGIEYAIIVGEDEIRQGKVKLKDMQSGKEEMIAVKDAEKRLKS